MSKNFGTINCWVRKLVFATVVAMATVVGGNNVFGQNNGNFFQTVGGIKIDPSGVLGHIDDQFKNELVQKWKEQLDNIDPAIAAKSDLRMISIKGIEEALQKAMDTGEELPDEIKFMAGIQRLQYIFVYPDKNDIVLAGVGEGWKIDDQGNVVGETSGAPVIRLEDFLVAMQTADNARRDLGISVSIDPTQEGVQDLQRLFGKIGRTFGPKWVSTIEETMGPNNISLTGVPTDSRYANVLVAADHRMKRLAMGFEQAPVDGMPSVLELARNRRKALSMTPRFWLECSYAPVKRSEDGLAWQISGAGAKALTEEDSLLQPGQKVRKSHPIATQWAESMTEQFTELAGRDPVFAELRNILDMSVIAALIKKEDLLGKVKLDASLVTGAKKMDLPKWNSPKTVPAQCSYCKVGGDWMITASGGIQVDSWGVLKNTQVDNSISETRTLAASSQSSSSVYWNSK